MLDHSRHAIKVYEVTVDDDIQMVLGISNMGLVFPEERTAVIQYDLEVVAC